MSDVQMVRPLPPEVLRERIADVVSDVLAWNDRASPYAIADRLLDMPEVAGPLSFFQLAGNVGLLAQGIETGTAKSEALSAKHESPVAKGGAPKHSPEKDI